MFVVFSLLASMAWAQDGTDPTVDEVIAAAEDGGVEKVKDVVMPGLDISVEFEAPVSTAFLLLSFACDRQETPELARACDARLAEFEKTWGVSFTDGTTVQALTPPRRRTKGGFVVIVEDWETGTTIYR